MNLYFNSIRLVNFGSYEDSTVQLAEQDFCLIMGKNNFKKDSAYSNGSGKSIIWSALCWVLTGETISGLRSNLKNIYIDSKNSFVALNLIANADNFIITRYLAPKADLKIIKNDVDISGKGLRETEKVLADVLPDLTKDLLCSTIIIGQGMPNKFTSFSPSGRKELLEKLTKTDFMINDIKERIKTRFNKLTTMLRQYDDSILATNTELNLLDQQKKEAEQKLNIERATNYAALISDTESQLATLSRDILNNENQLNSLQHEYEQLNDIYLNRTAKKASEEAAEFQAYSNAYNNIKAEYTVKQEKIKYLTASLTKLKNITDICPTCGQRIIGIIKPDTKNEEQEIKELTDSSNTLKLSLDKIVEQHNIYKKEIATTYADLTEQQNSLNLSKKNISALTKEIATLKNQKEAANNELAKFSYLQQGKEQAITSLQQLIDNYNSKIFKLNDTIQKAKNMKTDCEERLAINKQFDSFSKKEFRGYLLYNIIEYLNRQVQEFAKIIFDTDELTIHLNTNAIEIAYCGKCYENLSGGEKQRIDLILQFAIRSLLQQYFNYSSNILVLDEITDNLDAAATNKIFNFIVNQLKDIGSIFIISHHADELEIPVDSKLLVIKNANGISHIEGV